MVGERRALVRAAGWTRRGQWCSSPAYDREERAYAEGIASFIGVARRALAERLRQDERTGILSVVGVVVVLGLSLAVWSVSGTRRATTACGPSRPTAGARSAEHALLQAHEELETRVEQRTTELRVLFDLIPAMVWFKDTKNGILRVNRRAAEAAGMPVEQIEGRPSIEVYPEAEKFYADDRT